MTALFAGAWGGGTDQQAVHVEAGWERFKDRCDNLATLGLRLVSFDVSERQGDEPLWSGVATKDGRLCRARRGVAELPGRLAYADDGPEVAAHLPADISSRRPADVGRSLACRDRPSLHFPGCRLGALQGAIQGARGVGLAAGVDRDLRREQPAAFGPGFGEKEQTSITSTSTPTWNEFKSRYKTLFENNVRLADLRVFTDNGHSSFAGAWRRDGPALPVEPGRRGGIFLGPRSARQ